MQIYISAEAMHQCSITNCPHCLSLEACLISHLCQPPLILYASLYPSVGDQREIETEKKLMVLKMEVCDMELGGILNNMASSWKHFWKKIARIADVAYRSATYAVRPQAG
jgi:hypothetical protein